MTHYMTMKSVIKMIQSLLILLAINSTALATETPTLGTITNDAQYDLPTWIDSIGWLGSLAYLASYFLLSYNFIDKGRLYYLLNILGALFMIVISVEKSTVQPIVINIYWLYMSIDSYFSLNLPKIKITKKFLDFSLCFSIAIAIVFMFYNYSYALNILAWASVLSFLGSFYLFVVNKITEHSFHFYNAIAAFMIIPQMLLQGNTQVVVLEAFWLYFALSAFYKKTK